MAAYAVAAWLAMSAAVAQEDLPTEKSPSNKNTRELEEIIVIGERTFFLIRFQIREAEENLYAMFNELNSSDEFDIKCRQIKLTKSQSPSRM